MSVDITSLLFDPERFFEELPDDPSIKGPAAVVLGLSVLTVLSTVVLLIPLVGAAPGGTGVFFLVGGVIGGLIAGVAPVVGWLINAALFHGITYFFDGEGEFRDTFLLIGWGYVPRYGAALLSIAAAASIALTAQPPASLENVTAYTTQLQSRPPMQAANAAGILFSLWSAYLWIPAVQRARNVTRREATIAVAIPVGLGILLTVVSLVGLL